VLFFVLCVVLAAALAGSQAAQARTSPLGIHAAGVARTSGKPTVSTRSNQWSAYVADEATCPGADAVGAPVAAQVRAMSCLVNYARARRGLRKLVTSPKLAVAARMKLEQIRRCGVFDHAPCGGSPTAVADQAGYKGSFGENLFIGETTLGSARQALKEWLASPPHRQNMFSKGWRVRSLGATHVDELEGFVNATVWVAQFGDR
jgi:uncharacterized protein YkwD